VLCGTLPREPRPFTGDPWIHFCNGSFEVYSFLNKGNNVLLIIIMEEILGEMFILFGL